MTNVMTRAWDIAKEGQNKFGGKVKEYFAESLKMAWAETKAPKTVIVKTTTGSRKHKSWVAEITGACQRWGLNREFIKEIDEDFYKHFELHEGKVYEVCNAGDREFVQVVNGEIEYLEQYEVKGLVA